LNCNAWNGKCGKTGRLKVFEKVTDFNFENNGKLMNVACR
jgi:hypothetical protein